MKSLSEKIARARRHGTILFGAQRRLYRLGINIAPYYLFREQYNEEVLPEFKNQKEEYRFEFLSHQDMKAIGESDIMRGDEQEYTSWLERGLKCIGAKHQGKIVAYGWIDLEECHFPGIRFQLKDNEAYLFNMFTAVPYRGKNIAVNLRHETYKALNELGRNTFYSISEVYNKPALRFKQKLNAKILKKGLFIELFKKIRLRIPLKTFDNGNI